MDVTAIYFPAWHRDALNERWYGEGWSEWKLMERGRPLFPGHEQPKLCTWGSFDEADPLWMERQIDLAADHGITTFLFDWYWYSGQKFMHRALEEGFLKARNRERLTFFVMWANHTWGVLPAAREEFKGYSGGEVMTEGQALAYDRPLLEIKHTMEDLRQVTAYCAERYMKEPNYHRLGGMPVFSFWRWEELEKQLGGVEGVREAFEMMRGIVREKGLPGLHIMVNIACYENPEAVHCWWPNLTERIKTAGGDSVYGYNVARTHGYADLTNEAPLVPSEDNLKSHEELFRLCENRGLPFHPVATVGFDNTPRWHRGATLPLDFRKYFYEPIVVGNTPEQFGLKVKAAVESIRRSGGGDRMLLVNAWNEWTEGCMLLPDNWHGMGHLNALKNVLTRHNV